VGKKVVYMKYLLIFLLTMISSCTYSVTMVHTEGQATDVVDEIAPNTSSTTVSPALTVPITAI